MSLHNWNNVLIPGTLEVIRDNEYYFLENTMQKLDSRMDYLLAEHVDRAKFLDNMYFIDRFGAKVSLDKLSTGGKTVLNVFYNPTVCFDCTEAGDNAHAVINSKIINGNVVMCMPWILGEEYVNTIDIIVGNDENKHFHSIIDYSEYLDLGRYGDPVEMEGVDWY